MRFRFEPAPATSAAPARLPRDPPRPRRDAGLHAGRTQAPRDAHPSDLREARAEIVLANTYPLLLRAEPDLFRRVGGIHRFMRWPGPVLTVSGASRSSRSPRTGRWTRTGARFRSYVDQRFHVLSPERSIEVDRDRRRRHDGARHLPPLEPPSGRGGARRWSGPTAGRLRSLAARTGPEQALFAIVRGGLDPELRAQSAAFRARAPSAASRSAPGGRRHGDERGDVIERTAELLPARPAPLPHGARRAAEILEAIGRGVDMFDCVLPTTMAWQGSAFTGTGRVRLTRSDHRLSDEPLDAACGYETCRTYSRGYLHHLVGYRQAARAGSSPCTTSRTTSTSSATRAIEAGRYATFAREKLAAIDRHEHDPSGRAGGEARPEHCGPRASGVERQARAVGLEDGGRGEDAAAGPLPGPEA